MTHVGWDKVPGKSLNQVTVWDSLSGPLREAVCANFRDIWKYVQTLFYQLRGKLTDRRELRRYRWEPGMPALGNIFYDEVTETIYMESSISLT